MTETKTPTHHLIADYKFNSMRYWFNSEEEAIAFIPSIEWRGRLSCRLYEVDVYKNENTFQLKLDTVKHF